MFGFRGVNAPPDTDFCDICIEYPGEYEAICETVLAFYQGPIWS
jgi:hypothetical protein